MFSLKLLGGASIEGSDGPLVGRLSQRRRLALLSVLALAGPRPVSRDRLLALLWPESDAERARHSLADSVYQIRKEAGETAIISVGEDLLMNCDLIRSDVAAFENAIERGEWHVAVSAYGGPLLDGFHLSDAPEFERWLDAERDRLARACARALEQLAHEATAKGEIHKAVDWWRQLLARDPYNGRITLRLMQVLEAAGDRAAAIQQARTHTTLMEQEFAAEPDPEVTAFAERLRASRLTKAARAENQHSIGSDTAAAATTPVSAEAPAAADELSARVGQTAAGNASVKLRRIRTAVLLALFVISAAVVLSFVALLPTKPTGTETAMQAANVSSKAVAVLPCANLSGDPNEEYFSDGLTEELITVLSQVRALRVVARTSAFAFKGQNRDIREVGEALNVGTVVECSVRRAGDRFRVTAQLINAADGFHLWAETYEREGTNIFQIQSELAVHIAEALQAELNPADRVRLTRRPTTNPDAYASYLKGRHFWNQRTSASFMQAVQFFERAIALDSQYAPAYAGLARVYALQGVLGLRPPREAGERMRVAALQAVALDDDLAEAHAELGAYLNVYAWQSEASEREYLRAIELDPSYSVARHLYGNLLLGMGRYEESLAQRRMALQLDPLSPQLHVFLGYALLGAGRMGDALTTFRDAVELDSMYWWGHAALGDLYAEAGRFDEAVRSHRRAVELAGTLTNAVAGLARVLAQAGNEREAKRLLAQLEAEAARTGIYAPAVAFVILALEDVDGALAWLERSYRQKHPQLRVISPDASALFADDPRYLDLRRRIGLLPLRTSRN